jgi:branched-chain amino acid transport system substrate-binding protein
VPIIEAGGMEKSISAWTYNATIDAPSNKAFVEKIKAKYKSEPYLQTWAATTPSASSPGDHGGGQHRRAKIKDAIKNMTFTNVMGKTVKFDDHNPGRPLGRPAHR